MKQSDPIYVVTTLRFGFKYADPEMHPDGKYHSYYKRTSEDQKEYYTIVSSRTWGWYKELDDAKECVLHNYGDIAEIEYHYALIEEVKEGVLWGVDIPKEWWYKWEGDWEDGEYQLSKKPDEEKNVICFLDRMKGRITFDRSKANDHE